MKEEINKGKQTAIVSYLTIVGSIIAIFMNQEENRSEFASFHIRQALGIFLTFFLLGYPVGYFDNWINGEMKIVPFLGEIYQKLFKSF